MLCVSCEGDEEVWSWVWNGFALLDRYNGAGRATGGRGEGTSEVALFGDALESSPRWGESSFGGFDWLRSLLLFLGVLGVAFLTRWRRVKEKNLLLRSEAGSACAVSE